MIYTNMHDELKYYLRYLADEEYQKTQWIPGQSDERVVNFDDIVHFFFDDTRCAREPEDCVGWFLRDDEEVFHVRRVVKAVEHVLATLKSGFKDWQYIQLPEWRAVLTAANAALQVVSKPIPPLAPSLLRLLELDGIGEFLEGYRANLRNPGYLSTPEWKAKMAAAEAELIEVANKN